MKTEAPKLDTGKARLDLLAPDFLHAMGRVMAFGAKKYAAWSWSDGKAWSKDYAAVLRHMTYWANGEDLDPESGESHLAHAASDIMFLLVSQLRGLGTDDRKKFAAPVAVVEEPAPVEAVRVLGTKCDDIDCYCADNDQYVRETESAK